MMRSQREYYYHKILQFVIASVWLVNGVICKLLNLVPRHQFIVSRILGERHAVVLTRCIGILEVLMTIWILSGIKSRWCTVTQITVILLMNIIEFILVPEFLLFGRWNLLIAILFIVILIIHEFTFKDERKNSLNPH
jgi:uncharacterized membrane protein YphA (DoxX/SURF4 family)